MKRILSFSFLITILLISLSGCVITDINSEYVRKEFKSEQNVTEIVIIDESTNITFQTSNSNEISIEYSDSETEPRYSISIKNGVLEMEKTDSTVGVDDNSLIISLPQKEYDEISVNTTNGNITFEHIKSSVYHCSTENGNIDGTILGEATDYLCVITVKNGDSSLENNLIESSKIIEFNVKNGDVKVNFAQ